MPGSLLSNKDGAVEEDVVVGVESIFSAVESGGDDAFTAVLF